MVIEITSPSTRNLDLNEKLVIYHQAGVPRVVLIDAANPRHPEVIGLQVYDWAEAGYQVVDLEPPLRVWLEELKFHISIEDNTVVLRDRNLTEIEDFTEQERARWAEWERAEAERIRAERAELTVGAERDRAEAEKARAEAARETAAAERARAEQAEARLARLERLLARAKAQGLNLDAQP